MRASGSGPRTPTSSRGLPQSGISPAISGQRASTPLSSSGAPVSHGLLSLPTAELDTRTCKSLTSAQGSRTPLPAIETYQFPLPPPEEPPQEHRRQEMCATQAHYGRVVEELAQTEQAAVALNAEQYRQRNLITTAEYQILERSGEFIA